MLQMKYWAAEDRPAYKVSNFGVMSVTDAELLALLIGEKDNSDCVTIARNVLSDNGNSLSDLSKLSVEQLEKYEGVGRTKAMRILSALELGKRMHISQYPTKKCDSPLSVKLFMSKHLNGLQYEEFWAIYLTNKNNIIKEKKIGQGGLTETMADVRLILKEALLCNATQIIVCHNHPSGSLTPSKYDDQLTMDIAKACNTMRLRLADHVIYTNDNYYSYHENGKL